MRVCENLLNFRTCGKENEEKVLELAAFTLAPPRLREKGAGQPPAGTMDAVSVFWGCEVFEW